LGTVVGACCKSDGTCTETIASNCTGFFHGAGTTCGPASDSICNKPGCCCQETTSDTRIIREAISDQLTCTDCLQRLASQKVKFAGNFTTIATTNCNKIFDRIGACCDGRGNCQELLYNTCVSFGGFYQGDSSSCFDTLGRPVCASGTGPCCINGTCSQTSFSTCFTSNGFYGGITQPCDLFTCPTTISCLGFVDGVPISPGSKYGGGIVAGVFNPGKSLILGAKTLFSPIGVTGCMPETTYPSEFYTSYVDHRAYGITKDCNNINESYVLIVYPDDVYIDSNLNVKTPTQTYQHNTFPWGATGSSWGPMPGGYDIVSGQASDPFMYSGLVLNQKEGFWSRGFTGATQAQNIGVLANTFPTCPYSIENGRRGTDRAYERYDIESLFGYWKSSWGLYNTIRAVCANNAYWQRVVLPNYTHTYNAFYAVTTIPNAFRVTRLLSDGLTSDTQGATPNNVILSGWYLPSHDELAFIAANTTNAFGYNINQNLVVNGEPLNGTYWTSTGAFDFTKNEGISNYTNNTFPPPGSVGIAMNIDVNGNVDNYKVYKASRQDLYKVRPVRMLRCDGLIPAETKLWYIPPVYKDRIVNKNQTINNTTTPTLPSSAL
jgi:hypothetical protein